MVPQLMAAQPTRVVSFHTRAVKWPVAELKPGALKLYCAISLYQLGTAPLTAPATSSAPSANRFSPSELRRGSWCPQMHCRTQRLASLASDWSHCSAGAWCRAR